LNDTLKQIELCWRYAEKYHRVLVIDTEYLVADGISVKFSKLFEPNKANQNLIFELNDSLLSHLNLVDTYPKSCRGRLDKYQPMYDESCQNIVDKDFGTRLTFKFNKNYDEELLVHDQCGGGELGIHGLARLKLVDKFRSDVFSKLAPLLGQDYLAVSVRHTDYQTDYKRFFDEIYDKSVQKKLLVCSDSIAVIEYAKDFFKQSELIILSTPPDTRGMGFAGYSLRHCNEDQRYELMVSTITDLIGLATASRLIFSKLTPNEYGSGIKGFSGFAVLSAHLRNKPSIVNQLLNN